MGPPGGSRVAAVLDIGSNSVLLLAVALAPDGRARAVDTALVATRLGAGLGRGARLDPPARARTAAAGVAVAARARQAGADLVWAFGTGAMRRAADGAVFARGLAAAAGVAVEVLSGEHEARLAYAAVAHGLGVADGPLLVADVGGATTELTLGRGEVIEDTASVPLGALALTEQYPPPPGTGRFTDLAGAVATELGRVRLLAPARRAHARLVASGGTATALAAVDIGLAAYDARRVHGHIFVDVALRALVRRLIEHGVPAGALDPGRAAILPAGAIVLESVASAVGAARVQVSDHGVRHAYLRERLAEVGIAVDLRDLWR